MLIASLAAHAFPRSKEVDVVLKSVTAESAVTKLADVVISTASISDPAALSTAAYALSKYAIIRLCEQRAEIWGRRGARLNSLSPGMIETSMGVMEARGNSTTAGLVELAPIARWGTPLEIATGVEFLLSEKASFVTGSDLRVDGGLAAKLAS